MYFAIDHKATLLLFLALTLLWLLKIFFFSHSVVPSLAFSRVFNLKHSNWRSKLGTLPKILHCTALIFLLIAFIDPHLIIPKKTLEKNYHPSLDIPPTEGIAIYLVLDQSGSMKEAIEYTNSSKKTVMISKIDQLKNVTKQFILNHPSDLIGLVAFARVPHVLAPLTLDQESLLSQLNEIQVVKTTDEEGTAIGYAIYKTAHLLAATRHFANDEKLETPSPYTIKSAVIIVVTDGFQDPSQLDQGNRLRTLELDDAANYAKSQNIRLYIINIDPSLVTGQFAPQRRQLQQITSLTGGQFYSVNDSQGLQDIYSAIDHLEKGEINRGQMQSQRTPTEGTRFSFYPYMLLLALIALFSSLFLELTLLRRIP